MMQAGTSDRLHHWHRFETDHPETFLGMYIFTVGKNAP